VRTRFWFEAIAALVSLACFTVTLVVPTWIESAFGVDPDRGSGAMEWAVVAVAAAVTLAMFVSAYRELRIAGAHS
jgi:hypothetical protein